MLCFADKTFSNYCSIQTNLVLLKLLLRKGTTPHYFLQVFLSACSNQKDQRILEHNTENMYVQVHF
jgi:hypothetical protein